MILTVKTIAATSNATCLLADALYDTNPLYGRRRSKDLVNGGGKHFSSGRVPPLPTDHPGDLGSTYHSYMALDVPDRATLSRPNTTIIPPSKLFAKSQTTSCKRIYLF